MSRPIGIIVGSGAGDLGLDVEVRSPTKTPYGAPSSAILRTSLAGRPVLCIARHGERSHVPPHLVNYRANVWALREHGVSAIVGINAVGVIDAQAFLPGELAIPDQLIDYTWGREHTYETGTTGGPVRHAEFTEPFEPILRGCLAAAAGELGSHAGRGVYGVTQGPRLETAAEIARLARDGCTMVGMTAMPEAALARELGVPYAVCAVGVNYAAGCAPGGSGIHAQLGEFMARGMAAANRLLERVAAAI